MKSSIYQTYKPAGGSDNLFLKLKAGDSVKMRIGTDPAIYEQTFTDEEGKITISTRYAWGVWNLNEEKAQVFSQGKSVFNQLADLVEEWGEPTEFAVTVKRTGEMLETRYSVTPAPKSVPLTDAQVKAVADIDLLGAVKGRWLKDVESDQSETAPQSKVDKVYPVTDDFDPSQIPF